MEHYRSLFEIALNPDEVQKIRRAAVFSTPPGNDRFREQMEAALNRSVGFTKFIKVNEVSCYEK